jgi:hypothetical protein
MKIGEILSIDGTSNISILCYGVFRASQMDIIFDYCSRNYSEPKSRYYKLMDEDWPNGIILNEIITSNESEIYIYAYEALMRMMSFDECIAGACMYDGAFGDYKDFLSPNISSSIYAICIQDLAPVVALDLNILSSPEWTSVISYVYRIFLSKHI